MTAPLSEGRHQQATAASWLDELPAAAQTCLMTGAVLRRFQRGSVLFRAGEPAEAVWLLRAGRVQLLRQEPEGRAVIIRQVQPDDLFAEVALFRNGPYPVTAQAVTAGSALAISRSAFRECLTNADFRDAFLASLFERLRYLVGRIRQLSALGVEERLADWLLTQYGARAVIRPDVTKKQLAAQINVAPETLSRLLGRLKRTEMLIWQGGVIRVQPAFWALAERKEQANPRRDLTGARRTGSG